MAEQKCFSAKTVMEIKKRRKKEYLESNEKADAEILREATRSLQGREDESITTATVSSQKYNG